MGRKIEIELTDALYSDLLREAEEQGYKLQQYIELKLNEGLKAKGLQAVKKLVVKELQDTIKRVEALRPEELETEEKGNRILVYSYQALMQQSIALPEELEDKIAFYREREWLEERLFYLIVSRKRPVGLIGIMPQQESMPYGDYLHIYGMYLDKSLQTKKNLSYIGGYIQAVAKQEKVQAVDISNTATNISEEQLKEMGFHSFSTTRHFKGKVKEGQSKEDTSTQETVELTDTLLKEYILTERTLPLALLLKLWEKRGASVATNRISLQLQEGERISYILIKERAFANGENELKLTILIKPICLYDIKILEGIYLNVLSAAAAEVEGGIIAICLPEELKGMASMLKITAKADIKWYRRLVP